MHGLVTLNYTNNFFFLFLIFLVRVFLSGYTAEVFLLLLFFSLVMAVVLVNLFFFQVWWFQNGDQWEVPMIWVSQGFCKDWLRVLFYFSFPTMCPVAQSMFATNVVLLAVLDQNSKCTSQKTGGNIQDLHSVEVSLLQKCRVEDWGWKGGRGRGSRMMKKE